MGTVFINDSDFAKKWTLVQADINIPKFGATGIAHPDLIINPSNPNEVLMAYTPWPPEDMENMMMAKSNLSDMRNWNATGWTFPLIDDKTHDWNDSHTSDFCLLHVPELNPKWWTWFQADAENPDGSVILYTSAIALGQSNDGIVWTDNFPENPVMRGRLYPENMGGGDTEPLYNNSYENPKLRAPSVLYNRKTKKFEMFYDDAVEDWLATGAPPIRLARAESDDGKIWIRSGVIYDPASDGYGTNQGAFHCVVRYFDGHYWCIFPMYGQGLFLMTSPTGMPGTWTHPTQVLTKAQIQSAVGGSSVVNGYRVGILFDSNYKLHMIASVQHTDTWRVHYFTSELSIAGRTALDYTVTDNEFGGTVIKVGIGDFYTSGEPVLLGGSLLGTVTLPVTEKITLPGKKKKKHFNHGFNTGFNEGVA